jgi:transposase
MKTFRPYAPRQSFLFPPSPLEWLPEDHLAYFILDVVSQLDLAEILEPYEREERGYPPHPPQMMLGLLLYGYCVGVPSSRKIERKTYEDVAFRVVAGGTHPDHSCIADFRARHRKAFAKVFKQVVQLCIKADLVKLGHIALDGTKMKANASCCEASRRFGPVVAHLPRGRDKREPYDEPLRSAGSALGYTFGTGLSSPAGRMRTWRGFTPFAGPTMPSRSMRSMILAALL